MNIIRNNTDELKRVKILFVDYYEILNLLNQWTHEYTSLTINREELPDGFKVVSVHNNHEMRGFDVLLSHPSFDPVEPGQIPPRLDSLQHIQMLYKVERV